ncbi:MAG: serine/threonine protein kinase, partial [Gemmataceae bacterium]|nr:serine/threonine protein kinase [Gemmataceae bacterium]
MSRVPPTHEPPNAAPPGARETDHTLPQTVAVDAFTPAPAHALDQAHEPGERLRPGDRVLGFTLVEQLGEGAFATVFLAEQEALAGRRVVLKVTAERTVEPERLGRLQHPNVVPIHSVHELAGRELICMPFLGRHTLAGVIAADRSRRSGSPSTQPARGSTRRQPVSKSPGHGSRGQADGPNTPAPADPAQPPPADELPSPTTDVRWVLDLLGGLAAGLEHAHARGILHLDIKPANVLLADSGEPMLLDFNLSHDTAGPPEGATGGTVPYMAPEQLDGLLHPGAGRVDARTDLYALGVLAYELLTGEKPYPAGWMSRAELGRYVDLRRTPAPAVRAKNPAVPRAVAAVVAKLLAPAPGDRYRSAAELRTDLDRQRADRPLLHAPDRHPAERLAKWRRRNPWLGLKL